MAKILRILGQDMDQEVPSEAAVLEAVGRLIGLGPHQVIVHDQGVEDGDELERLAEQAGADVVEVNNLHPATLADFLLRVPAQWVITREVPLDIAHDGVISTGDGWRQLKGVEFTSELI